jgi:hypothetical protein
MNKLLDVTLCRAPAIAALVFALCGSAGADDFLLLRDGTQKRGAISGCDRDACRLGPETVPRASIVWIGLDRDAPTPPAVRDTARDELHLVNRSVQSATLNGVDSGFVHTTLGGRGFQAASSLPRKSVAWIHLGRPQQGSNDPAAYDPAGKKKTRTEGEKDEETKQDTAGAPWRLPSRIYVFVPRRCPACEATLHVLDLKQEEGNVLLAKSRTISVSAGLLTGSWFAYDPPVPVFPATIDTARFAFDGERKTSVTHEFYLENRGSGARGGGGTGAGGSAGGVPRGPGGPGIGPSVQPLRPSVDRAIEEARESVEDWWRERFARDSAAGQAGTPRSGSGGKRQHAVHTGTESYNETLRIENWQIIARDYLKSPEPYRAQYSRLQKIPVYDVEFDLRFSWLDQSGRGRDVDNEGYTTDWSAGPGSSRRQVPEDTPGIPHPRPQQDDGGSTLDWLIGDRFQSAREGIASLQRRVESAQESASEAADAARRQADAARRGAAAWFRHAMGGGIGGASGNQQGVGTMRGYSHAVSLHMRWFREQGRITEYTGEILRHAVEGIDGHFDDIRVSATRPLAAFDLPRPPLWTPPNPRPPPPPPRTGPGWFRP